MSERPILFSPPMVRAILEGRKTVTRRVVAEEVGDIEPAVWIEQRGEEWFAGRCGLTWKLRAYASAGDHLWVRETYRIDADFDDMSQTAAWEHCDAHDHSPGVSYDATDRLDATDREAASLNGWGKARPSIHMPRWASRITLAVKSVRVERLQEITEEDAVAEGIELMPGVGAEQGLAGGDARGRVYGTHPYTIAFASIWDDINGKRPGCAWTDNPWVWRVEFARIEQEARVA